MFIWNNEAFVEEKKEIVGKIHQQRTKEEQLKMSQQMNTGLWYGDYHSPNDNFPYVTEPNQRRRMSYVGDDWNSIVRVEMSKSIIETLLNPP